MSADYRIRPADDASSTAPPLSFLAKDDDMARHLYAIAVQAVIAKGHAIVPMILERFDHTSIPGLVVPNPKGVWNEVRVNDG